MEKSCENCKHSCPWLKEPKVCGGWKASYATLEQENAKLTQALERACEWISGNSCIKCPLYGKCDIRHKDIIDREDCKIALNRHFKEVQG
jgi:hypothetical protein